MHPACLYQMQCTFNYTFISICLLDFTCINSPLQLPSMLLHSLHYFVQVYIETEKIESHGNLFDNFTTISKEN